MSLSGLWNVVTGTISSCNISGPIGMAQVMGQAATQGLEYYITMLAVMSLGIGLINLFPIPVLDGGHLVFHAYETADKALQKLKVLPMQWQDGWPVVEQQALNQYRTTLQSK